MSKIETQLTRPEVVPKIVKTTDKTAVKERKKESFASVSISLKFIGRAGRRGGKFMEIEEKTKEQKKGLWKSVLLERVTMHRE